MSLPIFVNILRLVLAPLVPPGYVLNIFFNDKVDRKIERVAEFLWPRLDRVQATLHQGLMLAYAIPVCFLLVTVLSLIPIAWEYLELDVASREFLAQAAPDFHAIWYGSWSKEVHITLFAAFVVLPIPTCILIIETVRFFSCADTLLTASHQMHIRDAQKSLTLGYPRLSRYFKVDEIYRERRKETRDTRDLIEIIRSNELGLREHAWHTYLGLIGTSVVGKRGYLDGPDLDGWCDELRALIYGDFPEEYKDTLRERYVKRIGVGNNALLRTHRRENLSLDFLPWCPELIPILLKELRSSWHVLRQPERYYRWINSLDEARQLEIVKGFRLQGYDDGVSQYGDTLWYIFADTSPQVRTELRKKYRTQDQERPKGVYSAIWASVPIVPTSGRPQWLLDMTPVDSDKDDAQPYSGEE